MAWIQPQRPNFETKRARSARLLEGCASGVDDVRVRLTRGVQSGSDDVVPVDGADVKGQLAYPPMFGSAVNLGEAERAHSLLNSASAGPVAAGDFRRRRRPALAFRGCASSG